MIGHIFATSDAVTLAVAPAPRVGDYLVLARVEGQYATAALDTGRMVRANGAPDHWMQGAYFRTLAEAVEDFAERSGLPIETVRAQAEHAEGLIDGAASTDPSTP